MSIDEAALIRFVETAKQRGAVSIGELRGAFPIDAMEVEDIAAIVLRLEEAGVSVEIDPSLFSPKHGHSLNPLERARTKPSKTTIGTGQDSRVSPSFQLPGPGDSLPKESSSGESSSINPSAVSSAGKRVILLLMLLFIIAFLALWGLSRA